MKKINVDIVDDHPLVAAGLKSLLHPYKQIHIGNIYESAQQLIAGLILSTPDLLILDIMLPDLSGKELVEEVRKTKPGLKILVFTSMDALVTVSSLMRRGCNGYLLKGANAETILEGIETVFEGKEYLQPSLKDLLINSITTTKHKSTNPFPMLTEREKEILQLIAMEYTTREISEKLYISYRTVENHRYSLLQKLDVKKNIGLIKVAIQLNLIQLN